MNIMYVLALSLCTGLTAYGMETGDGEIESPVILQAKSSGGLYQAVVYEKDEKKWVKVFENGSQTQNVCITSKLVHDLFFNSENELVVVYEYYDYNRQMVLEVGEDHPPGRRSPSRSHRVRTT